MPVAADHGEHGQRLTDFDAGVFAQFTAEGNHPADDGDAALKVLIDKALVHLRVIAPVDAGRGIAVNFTHQALVHFLGEEGHERGQNLGKGNQNLIEGLEGRALVGAVLGLPETHAVGTDIPVGEVVDEGNQTRNHRVQTIAFHARVDIAHQTLGYRENPAVRLGAIGDGGAFPGTGSKASTSA